MTAVIVIAVLLPLLAAAAVAGVRAPLAVVAFYAAFVPVGSAVPVPLPLPGPLGSLSSLVGIAALASMVAHLVVSREGADRLAPTVPLWLLFVGFAGATAAWSINPAETLADLLLLVPLVGLYVTTALLRIDAHDIERLELAIVAGGALVGLIGVVQLVTGTLPESGTGFPRFATVGAGDVGDPNITAAALLLPLLVALTHMLRPGSARRVVYAGAALLCLAGIVLTLSRGGLLAVLAGCVTLAIVKRRRAMVVVMISVPLLLVGIGLLAAPDGFAARVQQTGSTGRSQIWSVALAECPRYCWAGSGLGTFPDLFEDAVIANPRISGYELRYEAHSLWFGTAIEVGLPGLLLLLAALATLIGALWRLPRDARAAPLAALVALLVANSLLSNLEFKYFWLVLIYATLTTVAHPAARPVGSAPVRRFWPEGREDRMAKTRSDIATRLGWALRTYAPVALLTMALVTALAIGLPLLRTSSPTYRAAAVVVATRLEIRSDQLPRLAAAIFHSGGVAQEAVAEGDLPFEPEELIPDIASLAPVEDNIVLYVEGRASDPGLAARIANSVAEALTVHLNEAGPGVGRFDVQEPARVPFEAEPGPPLPILAVAGMMSGLVLALGIVGLLVVLRRPVLDGEEAAGIAGVPLIGSVALERSWDVDLRTVLGLSAVLKQILERGQGTAFMVSARGAERDSILVALLVARASARRATTFLVPNGNVPPEALRSLLGQDVIVARTPAERAPDSHAPLVVVGPSTDGLDAAQFLPGETQAFLVVRQGCRQLAVEQAAEQFLVGELSGVIFTRALSARTRRLGQRSLAARRAQRGSVTGPDQDAAHPAQRGKDGARPQGQVPA